MKRRTPQEKKRLSYEHDRRNVYGESPHAARKIIPLRKAQRNRANRHYQNQQLRYCGPVPDELVANELESRMRHKTPNYWKKFADAPLKEVVSRKLEGREVMRTQGGRRALITISYWGTYE